MTSAIMILCLAWTLSGICSAEYLNIGEFVKQIVGGNAVVGALIPCIFFLVAVGLSFATGTSWGTFGILIPIALAVVGTGDVERLTLAVASYSGRSCLCGDHISPISDTTILSSAGAQCNHLNHDFLSRQIPYALTVAGCCFVGYLVGGILQNGWIALAVGTVLLLAVLALILTRDQKAAGREAKQK